MRAVLPCLLALGLLAPLRGQTLNQGPNQNQSETAAIAAGFVTAQVPATDDPDATAQMLLRLALQHGKSPVAHVLVSGAIERIADLQEPAALRALLPDAATLARCHGRLAQRCQELRWQLDHAIDGLAAAGPLPALGYTHELLVAGPFGDAGNFFAGLPYPPELTFPALGQTLPGRGGPATVRVERCRDRSDYLFWRDRQDPRQGCYYGLQRHLAEHTVDAFLELETTGDCQLFVDDVEVLRIERWQQSTSRHHYIALHLPRGEHRLLLKATTNDSERCTLRFVDAGCRPVAAIRQLAHDAPAGDRAAPAERRPDGFVTAVDTLAKAADGGDPAIGIAAAWLALRDLDGDRALLLLQPLRQQPPTDAALALALARLLQNAPLPDEARKAEARALIERHAPALVANHHTARLLQVQLLEEQDQREQGLRLLRTHPAAGPESFARQFQLLRQLRFRAEEVPLLQQWRRQLPKDPEPLVRLAEMATATGDAKLALLHRQELFQLRRNLTDQAIAAMRSAQQCGDLALAAQLLDRIEPLGPGGPSFTRVHFELERHVTAGDDAAALAAMRALLVHPDADADYLRQLGDRAVVAGDGELATRCRQRSLALQPDQPALRALLAGVSAHPDEALLRSFHRDGSAAAAAFVAGPREDTGGTTILIDQRLVVVEPDGSWMADVHELRRINDQNGVDRFQQGAGLGDADEVLLVRTLATDGKEYVPARIDDDYALQQLAPGAFVEWRRRDRGKAPAAGTMASDAFLFGGDDEPCVLTELVVVLPKGFPGELRTRSAPEPAETRELPDGRRLLVYRRTDVEALPQERFRPSAFALLPIAQLGADASPLPPNRGQRIDMVYSTRPLAPIQAAAAQLFADAATPAQKAQAAWDFVQQKIEAGPADDALSTLMRQKGDRLLLMVALLRAGGVAVTPMLAQEVMPELTEGPQSLFAEDPWTVPGAWVELAPGDGLPLFADTPRHWPLGAVPAQRRGTQALLLQPTGVTPLQLPGSNDHVQQVRVRGTAKVQGKSLRLEATAELGDTTGWLYADRLRQSKENTQKMAARQLAQQLFEGWRVENAKAVFDPPGRPLQLQVTLTRGGVQAKGDGFVVPLPLIQNRFVVNFGDRAERTLPWHFPGDMALDWSIELDPGSELVVRALPPPLLLQRPPLWFHQTCSLQDGRVVCRRDVRIGAATLPAAEFADWLRVLTAADQAEAATITLGPR